MQNGDETGVLLQAVARHTFYRLPIVLFNDISKRDLPITGRTLRKQKRQDRF
jgi:hypothetical protein